MAENEYLKVTDLPLKNRAKTWIPWDKVRAIPEGHALDLTPFLDGRPLDAARSTIRGSLACAIDRGDARESDYAVQREGKLYIVRPERDDA